MTSDSTSSRVTSPDEPRTADELTLGEEPHEPRPVGSTATAAGSPRTEAAGGPYSSPYGPPYGPAGGGTTYGSTSPFGPGGPGAYGSDASAYASDPAGFAAAPPPPTDRKRRRQHWAGAILVLIGVLILGNNLGLLWWVQPEFLLPLILVGAGGWLLFGRGRRG